MQHLIRNSITAALAILVITLAGVVASSGSNPGDATVATGAAIRDVSAFGEVDSVDVCADGKRMHLLIGRNGEGEEPGVFRHTVSDDGGRTWRAPVVVNEGGLKPVNHHRGADAKLIARGDKLFAVWVTPGTGFGGTGPMGTALSTDGGKSWQPGPNPADHATTGSHRFMALTDDGHAFHLLWLDDRDSKRGLRHASSTDGGKTWSKNHTVDELTCACCWNTILHVPGKGRGQLFAMYRDIEPSDMGLAVSSDGGETWTKLGHVGPFGWIFKGCPHVGGGIASLPLDTGSREKVKEDAKGPTMFAAVWTGLPEEAGCYLFQSEDGGTSWTKVAGVGSVRASHPVITSNSKGHIALLWDEPTDSERGVMMMRSADGGERWAQSTRISNEGTPATHPVVIADPTSDAFVAMWTQLGDGGKYVLAMRRF